MYVIYIFLISMFLIWKEYAAHLLWSVVIVKTNSMNHQHTYNIYFLSHIHVNIDDSFIRRLDKFMLFISTMKATEDPHPQITHNAWINFKNKL